MIQIHPVGILAVIAVVMCWSFAWVLYRTGTPGSMARITYIRQCFRRQELSTRLVIVRCSHSIQPFSPQH